MLGFASRIVKENLIVKKFEYWTIAVRTGQVTVGSMIITLNRDCLDMTEVLPEEMAEFPVLCKWYQDRCKKLYDAEKFNYLALMMVDPFVHFHVIPRYSQTVEKYNMNWEDTGWPKLPNMGVIHDLTEEQLLQIREDFIKEDNQ